MTRLSPAPSRCGIRRQTSAAPPSQGAGLAVLGDEDAIAELVRFEVLAEFATCGDTVVQGLEVTGDDRGRRRRFADGAHLFGIHDDVAQPRHLRVAGIEDDDLRAVRCDVGCNVAMSHGELTRYDTLLRVERGELRVEDAATLLKLSRRQIFRLLGRLQADGAAGLVSSKRGKPSNRRYSDAFRERVISVVREHYSDFGPTLAREYLAERHYIHLACETLRLLMIDAGLWKDREARRPRSYQPRYRRDCRGELVQIDGPRHWWLEDRGPQSSLLVFIDDASSELLHLKMVETENTFGYMDATREYIERHGKPVAFYSDKHSVFRNPNASAARKDGMTHFGRALEALTIEIICAHSPQAKGRVERANGTLQDRLVKAMRLAGISSIEEANAFLPGYIEKHNQRFARPAFDSRDLHRPLALHDDLTAIVVWREQRTVTSALTLHCNKTMFILAPSELTRALVRQRVTVCEYPDGRVEIQHQGRVLP